jgi:ribosomal protein S27AE
MTHSKKCFKCETVKPIDEFYKHSEMSDGHLNKCKQCTKKDVFENREKNIERIRAYDRERAKHPDRIKASVAVTKAWRAADKRRSIAHNAVRSAILSGAIVRIPCVRCGETNSLAHHEDYDKPLDVMWLCQPCHKKRHKEINKQKLDQSLKF